MPSYTTDAIRNIALVGHGGAGKTTLVEALLSASGAISQPGTITKGNTVADFDPLERQHQHSLDATPISLDYQGCHINLIDTPGFPDFIGQAISVLPAVETVAVVINAQNGIETVTQRLMDRAVERQLCRMIIINKIDAEGVDLEALVAQIQENFGRECLPLNLPAEGASRVVDCFFNPDGVSDFSSVADTHEAIVDQVVEVDENLMELYLEQGEELNPEQLHDSFERALREGHLVPICFVSGQSGAGVSELLEVIHKLLPNPTEGNPRPFLRGEGDTAEPFQAEPDPTKHALAHVFKVIIDPFVGKLALFRIHQGTITRDSQLYIGDARKPFKVGHLFKIHGKEHPEVEAGIPGDICAVAKVDDIHHDAVLHDSHDEDHIHLQALRFPVPLYGLAVSPQTRGDEQKLSDTLHKLMEEDPCLQLEQNQSTGERVLRGLSDLHLRITLEKMATRYRLEVATAPPKIAYKETISQAAEGHHRHKKQTGGAGQFGEVFLRVEPRERGSGFEFVSEIVGGAIPAGFLPAIEKGIREAMGSGAVAGYALQDVKAVVYDGKHHPVDSKEVAFVTAGREAFLDAVRQAAPIILEPMVNIEIIAPADYMGTLTGDLSGRRGRINGTNTRSRGRLAIAGQAPLAELEGYESQLRSMTAGEGSYSLEFSHYEPVPAHIQQQLCEAYRASQQHG